MVHNHTTINSDNHMPKKRILFILNEMIGGGPQRSLLNLLSVINKDKFELELLLFREGGVLFKEIPSYLKVSFVKPAGLFSHFRDFKLSDLIYLPLRVLMRALYTIMPLNIKRNFDIYWFITSIITKKNIRQYDLAIAYTEGMCIKFLAEKINSSIKIGRIPTDYRSANLNKKSDARYYGIMNYLFVVSELNKEILQEVFPEFQNKIMVFQSIVSPDSIRKKSFEGEGFEDSFDGIRILTIARLDLTKGIDLAMDSCSLLISRGLKIRWYFLGTGDSNYFMKKIKEKDLMNHFFLLKETVNPYTYLRQADIYVQPSRYEGKSNAVNEAKALCKKIIITNFSSAADHLVHMEEGIISEMDAESIALSITKLINSPELGTCFCENLLRNFKGNESEIEKLYQLLE